MRLRLRTRVALAFALAMGLVLAGLGTFLYARVSHDLLSGIDQELRARADLVRVSAGAVAGKQSLLDPDEAFAQVLTTDGVILESSEGVAAAPMLSATSAAAVHGPTFVVRRVAGVDDEVRLLAVPVRRGDQQVVVVVGATLGDRNEALHRLMVAMLVAGPVGLLIASWAGWLVAGLALRPVERLRGEAAAITASELDRRLDVPPTRDELARLAQTLNDLLARVEEAVRKEHRLVDDASHELRTPLAVLKAELDLALSKPRTQAELADTLHRAALETDRLVQLAEDLLVLARVDGLPVRREPTSLPAVAEQAAEPFRDQGLDVQVLAAGEGRLDPARLRQALVNLVDNAARHGAGPVTLTLEREGPQVVAVVRDHGPGFAPEMLAHGLEPFVRGGDGSGLGLPIVEAVARAHGGGVELENCPEGGASVTVRLLG